MASMIDQLLSLPQGRSAPRFSPGGDRLAYTRGGSVWVACVAKPCDPTCLGPGGAPKWRPDGIALAAMRDDGRVWLILVESAAAEPLSPDGVRVADFAFSPSGDRLAVMAEGPKWGDPGELWYIGAQGAAHKRATLPPFESGSHLRWSPDGRRLTWEALLVTPDRTDARTEGRWIYADEADVPPVYKDLGVDVRPLLPPGACQTAAPEWRPGSNEGVFLATPHPYGFQSLNRLAGWSLAVGASAARYLVDDPFLVREAIWSADGEAIYFTARHRGITTQIYTVRPGWDAPRKLTDDLGEYGGLDASPDRRWVAATFYSPDRAPAVRLVATDGGGTRTVAGGERPSFAEQLGRPDRVRWRAADGLELEGLLLYPPPYGPDNRPNEPLPTIVDIHGSPVRGNPPLRLGDNALYLSGLHALAAEGYLCFAVNYRRSGNYGWRHLQNAIDAGDIVGLDPDDVLGGIDHLVSAGLADPGRLGLRGYSHGGFLANWLITQTGRFRAAVSIEGMTDHATRALPDTILEIWLGGTPEQVPDRYRRASPITYAAQARTPTLLIYGENSIFVSHQQAGPFRDALAAAGVDADLVLMAGEGHFFGRRENQARLVALTAAWFDRHLRI